MVRAAERPTVLILAMLALGFAVACDTSRRSRGEPDPSGTGDADPRLFTTSGEPWVQVQGGQRNLDSTLHIVSLGDGAMSIEAVNRTYVTVDNSSGVNEIEYNGATFASTNTSGVIEPVEIFEPLVGSGTSLSFVDSDTAVDRQEFSTGDYTEFHNRWTADGANVTLMQTHEAEGQANADTVTASPTRHPMRMSYAIASGTLSLLGIEFEDQGGGTPSALASGQVWQQATAVDGVEITLRILSDSVLALDIDLNVDLGAVIGFGSDIRNVGGAVATFGYENSSTGGAAGELALAPLLTGGSYAISGEGTAAEPYQLRLWDISGDNTRYAQRQAVTFFPLPTVYILVIASGGDVTDVDPDNVWVFTSTSPDFIGNSPGWSSQMRGDQSYTQGEIEFTASGTYQIRDNGVPVANGHWRSGGAAGRIWYDEGRVYERP